MPPTGAQGREVFKILVPRWNGPKMLLWALAGRKRSILASIAAIWLIAAFMYSGFDWTDDPTTVSAKIYSNSSQNTDRPQAGNASSTMITHDDEYAPLRHYKGYDRPGFEKPLANGISLRIMCLGASTTRGDSPEPGIDNNGFRRPLRAKLTAAGNPVNFVGTQRLGNMTDNDIEALPGKQTHDIHENARKAVPKYRPNVLVVNAGSNDCYMHADIDNFYKRYDALIEYLLESPSVTVIICTVTPTWETERFNGRADMFRINPQIRRLYQIYKSEGKPVVLVDMQDVDGIADEDIASDGMHPGKTAYEMMATKLFHGFVEADARGFLQPPELITGVADNGEDDPGRKDDAYLKWHKEKKKQDAVREKAVHEEIERMKLELRKVRDVRATSESNG